VASGPLYARCQAPFPNHKNKTFWKLQSRLCKFKQEAIYACTAMMANAIALDKIPRQCYYEFWSPLFPAAYMLRNTGEKSAAVVRK
jgi:hypothetical protein